MKTVAVIVHWGPVAETIALARWLDGCAPVDEVIVVANDLRPPPDGVLATWIVPERNLGFGCGADLACSQRPGATHFLLLNNDVELDETTVTACLGLLGDDGGIGVVGPTLVNAGGLQSGVGTLTAVTSGPRVTRSAPPGGCDAPWVTGACMFVRAECYRQVRMDGRFFLCFEDVDFCVRAHAAGWRVVSAGHRITHAGGGTIPAGRYVYYMVRNRLWFVRIRGWKMRTIAVVLWALAFSLRVLASDLLLRRSLVSFRLLVHGLADGLRALPPFGEPLSDEPRPERWTTW